MQHFPFLAAAYGVTFLCLAGMVGWAIHRLRRVQNLLEEER